MKEPAHFVVRKFSSQVTEVRSPGVLVARAYSFDFDNCVNTNVTATVQLNVGLQYRQYAHCTTDKLTIKLKIKKA